MVHTFKTRAQLSNSRLWEVVIFMAFFADGFLIQGDSHEEG
jgi:hypothetical protein